jgi:nucleotide-binding universal stress UspA family protein
MDTVKHDIGRIVVGVDGSVGSNAALGWAAKEAGIRNVTLVVVSVWHPADAYDSLSGHHVRLPADVDAGVRATVQSMIDELRTNWSAPTTFPDVQVVTTSGVAADELLQFAGSNDLLVVGSRGKTGLAGLILGSVATRISHLARFPFAVIPHIA